MSTEKEFAENIHSIRAHGEPKGSATLATTFSVEDIVISRLLMRHVKQDAEKTEAALRESEDARMFLDWIMRHGAERAAHIVAIVERTA